MSAAQHTRPPATLHHCHLCGSQISIAYASRSGETWKADVQELRHASPPVPRVAQALVPPRPCGFVEGGGGDDDDEARIVHAACWAVVAHLWGRSVFTPAELDGFLDCARDVAPFLPEIPFREAPDRLDLTIDHRLDWRDMERRPGRGGGGGDDDHRRWESLCAGLEGEGITAPALLSLRRRGLPDDVDGFVSRALQRRPEAASRDDDDDDSLWTGVVSLLMPCLAGGGSSSIAQALRNLHLGGAACFPHTANHDVVRANATTILLKLLSIPVEDVLTVGRRAKLESPRAVPLAAIAPDAPFRMSFLTLRRECFVDYRDDGGSRVGMKYLRSLDFQHHKGRTLPGDAVPPVRALCGLRLIRDRIGALAVHAKDGIEWYSVWQQDPTVKLGEALAGRPTTAEWPAGTAQGQLLVISDTVKDQAVFDQFSQYMKETGWPEDARPKGFESIP